MPRTKTPDLEKAKHVVRALGDQDLRALAEWINLLLEIQAELDGRELRHQAESGRKS